MKPRNPIAGALRLFGKRVVEDKRRKERSVRGGKHRSRGGRDGTGLDERVVRG